MACSSLVMQARFLSQRTPRPGPEVIAFESSSPGDRGRAALPRIVAEAGWEGAWAQGVIPWDASRPAPMVSHLARPSGSRVGASLTALPHPVATVLVPGCGAGYDAIEWAASGRRTVGLDLSPTATAKARALAAARPDLPLTFDCGDFFSHAPREPYDLIWDYTFLGALPLELRPAWAAAARRLVRPGIGIVSLLLFPMDVFEGGPPFSMQPTSIASLLAAEGFTPSFFGPVPDELSHRARAGREWLGIWTAPPQGNGSAL